MHNKKLTSNTRSYKTTPLTIRLPSKPNAKKKKKLQIQTNSSIYKYIRQNNAPRLNVQYKSEQA